MTKLSVYQKKRRFERTPEPKGVAKRRGKSNAKADATPALRFVVQKHDASRLHYDFRLELDGVLKSWAVPQGPSLNPGKKVLAVQVEDHPLDYGDFEGVIPKGEYGGGTVLLWDSGTWEPLHDAAEGFAGGKLHFILHGEKLRGEWSLVQMHGKAGADGKNWLLMKLKDEFAKTSGDILVEEPKSVKSRRSLEQIAGQRDDVWSGQAKETGRINGAAKSTWPADFSPQLAVLAESPPVGDEWLHEIKFDGYRILAKIKNGEAKLITRNGNDWTKKFPVLAGTLAKVSVDSAIVDGELVILDKEGRSDFQLLQTALKKGVAADAVYFAFDVPFCDGFDLRQTPLLERKKRLEEILGKSKLAPRVQFSEHMIGDGAAVVEKACNMALEGVVSKRVDAPYVSRREATWLKSKCGMRQEFVVIGYTDPQRSRQGFGSLLLAFHDAEGRLVYAGRVGTGFDDKMLKSTVVDLRKLQQEKPPTDDAPPARERRAAHWVKPALVAEVKFTGWTRDGVLRHPAFVAFRSDKPAAQIVREKPVKPAKVEAMIESKTKVKPKPTAKNEELSGSDTFEGITLTHPDKVLYPDSGTTKRDIAEYYLRVAEWMLPHVVERPLALLRSPNGLASKAFFQRNWTDALPPAVGKVNISQGGAPEFHMAIQDLSGVIALAQIGVLEIHAWNCRVDKIERPDQLIFDLDPGPDLPWPRVKEAARTLKSTLDSLDLPTFLKTSGGKGLHLAIPIQRNVDWDSAKAFCATIAKSLAEKSELFVANMRKDLRGGKVYVDYNRNGRSATAVAPYSTRARAGAPVAMPIAWEELERLKSADQFNVSNAARYLAARKADPWCGFEKSRVDLRKLVNRKSAA